MCRWYVDADVEDLRAKFSYTHHARVVVKRRCIEARWVEEALRCPAKVVQDEQDTELKRYLYRVAEYEGRVLRVVANTASRPVLVVTAFFDRSMRGKL